MGPKLETVSIRKVFGSLVANNGVSLSFTGGRIYAILGENGAGKTTFLNVLFGIYQPTEGKILLDGKEVRFKSPKEALTHGVYLVQQNFSLIDNFTVAENLALLEGSSLSPLRLNQVVKKAQSSTQGIRREVDPSAVISKLPMNLRQIVEIQKGLLYGASILLLDEPTSVLAPQEAEELGNVLRTLASEGRIVIITSHKLAQVMKLVDYYIIMRKGQVTFSGDAKEIRTAIDLVRHMFGEDFAERLPPKQKIEGQTVLEATELEVKDEKGRAIVSKASLKVRTGNLVGVAGVAGNGQKELAEALTGLRRINGGNIKIGGMDVASVADGELRRKGIGYIPEEGAILGLVPDLTITENLSLTTFDLENSSLLLNHKAMSEKATRLIQEYGISPPDKDITARNLSGGNMFKLIVARELSRPLTLLVAYNPTKGLDMRATTLVHQKLLEQRNAGTAIVLISEDLEEIMQLSDYVAVMFEGRIVDIRETGTLSLQELGRLMSGHTQMEETT